MWWKRIVVRFNIMQLNIVGQDGVGCRYKWATFLGHYTKTINFHQVTNRNKEELFNIGVCKKKPQGLLRLFMDPRLNIYTTSTIKKCSSHHCPIASSTCARTTVHGFNKLHILEVERQQLEMGLLILL